VSKYPDMPSDVKNKLFNLRIKIKQGLTNLQEDLWCGEQFEKYGPDQYGSVITDQELFEKTTPNPWNRK
jgi:hypothetical protein